MDEYISREAAIEALSAEALERNLDSVMTDDAHRYHRAAERVIAGVPAADVRPVVLCRECVHWGRYDNTAGCGYCHKVKFEYGANGYVFNPVKAPDFYCADGRKADV